jgi:hypothetical protein
MKVEYLKLSFFAPKKFCGWKTVNRSEIPRYAFDRCHNIIYAKNRFIFFCLWNKLETLEQTYITGVKSDNRIIS